ncbi:MAG: NUDIX domain-containing protein [Anaerolineae bacterium]|nr:NUDIX domain-containing protein [Anaerolineae bacterium]
MADDRQLQKVTAFITRGLPEPREILVIRHPVAGLQVPAGTVEASETPRAAVLREAGEETGLKQLGIIALLNSRRVEFAADEGLMFADALLQLTPDYSSTVVTSFILRRGMRVKLLDSEGNFLRIAYEEETYRDGGRNVKGRHTGWVVQSSVTRTVVRHFFHLMASDDTAAEWRVLGDMDLTFSCSWQPLQADLNLLPPQDEWLRTHYGRLTQP